MKFFIDVEATNIAEEIISIGVVSEFGTTFKIFVKPQFSELDDYITNLTGITNADLEHAASFNEAMHALYQFVNIDLECDLKDAHFYSYGEDINFFRATGNRMVFDTIGFAMYSCIITNLVDASKDIFKFFNGTVSLSRAYNYINSIEKEQRHDALEDAMMLRQVFDFTKINKPFKTNLCPRPHDMEEAGFNMPKGRFYCRRSKKGPETEFSSCEEAIEWFIRTTCDPTTQDKVRRSRIMMKIMKAVRTNTKYGDYYWRRVKKEVEE